MNSPGKQVIHEIIHALEGAYRRGTIGIAEVLETDEGFRAKVQGESELWYDVLFKVEAVSGNVPDEDSKFRAEST